MAPITPTTPLQSPLFRRKKLIVVIVCILMLVLGVLWLVHSHGSGTKPSATSGQTGSHAVSAPKNTKLAAIDPCSLISTAIISQYHLYHQQYQGVNPHDSDSNPHCLWQNVVDNKPSYEVEVTLLPSDGLDTLTPAEGTLDKNPVGHHQGYLQIYSYGDKAGTGTCTLALGIDAHSRVEIFGTGADSLQDSCNVALQYGGLVEKQLTALGF